LKPEILKPAANKRTVIQLATVSLELPSMCLHSLALPPEQLFGCSGAFPGLLRSCTKRLTATLFRPRLEVGANRAKSVETDWRCSIQLSVRFNGLRSVSTGLPNRGE